LRLKPPESARVDYSGILKGLGGTLKTAMYRSRNPKSFMVSAISRVAFDSDVPGSRLNERVPAGNWP